MTTNRINRMKMKEGNIKVDWVNPDDIEVPWKMAYTINQYPCHFFSIRKARRECPLDYYEEEIMVVGKSEEISAFFAILHEECGFSYPMYWSKELEEWELPKFPQDPEALCGLLLRDWEIFPIGQEHAKRVYDRIPRFWDIEAKIEEVKSRKLMVLVDFTEDEEDELCSDLEKEKVQALRDEEFMDCPWFEVKSGTVTSIYEDEYGCMWADVQDTAEEPVFAVEIGRALKNKVVPGVRISLQTNTAFQRWNDYGWNGHPLTGELIRVGEKDGHTVHERLVTINDDVCGYIIKKPECGEARFITPYEALAWKNM